MEKIKKLALEESSIYELRKQNCRKTILERIRNNNAKNEKFDQHYCPNI